MTSEVLHCELTKYIASAKAKRLCQPYNTVPEAAWGELFVRLSERAKTQLVEQPEVWVRVNASGYLRN